MQRLLVFVLCPEGTGICTEMLGELFAEVKLIRKPELLADLTNGKAVIQKKPLGRCHEPPVDIFSDGHAHVCGKMPL